MIRTDYIDVVHYTVQQHPKFLSSLSSLVLRVANIYDSLNIKINGGNENDNSTMLMALGTIKFSLETSLHLSMNPSA